MPALLGDDALAKPISFALKRHIYKGWDSKSS